MSEAKVDAVSILDSLGVAGTVHLSDVRRVREAIAELIAADREYDAAFHGSVWDVSRQVAAKARRAAILSRIKD